MYVSDQVSLFLIFNLSGSRLFRDFLSPFCSACCTKFLKCYPLLSESILELTPTLLTSSSSQRLFIGPWMQEWCWCYAVIQNTPWSRFSKHSQGVCPYSQHFRHGRWWFGELPSPSHWLVQLPTGRGSLRPGSGWPCGLGTLEQDLRGSYPEWLELTVSEGQMSHPVRLKTGNTIRKVTAQMNIGSKALCQEQGSNARTCFVVCLFVWALAVWHMDWLSGNKTKPNKSKPKYTATEWVILNCQNVSCIYNWPSLLMATVKRVVRFSQRNQSVSIQWPHRLFIESFYSLSVEGWA